MGAMGLWAAVVLLSRDITPVVGVLEEELSSLGNNETVRGEQ